MKRLIIYLEGFLVINLIWLVTSLLSRNSQIPNPLTVYGSLKFFFIEKMHFDIILSFIRILVGISLAMVLGSTIGYFMASQKKLNSLLNPLVVFLYPVPKAVLLPVIIVIFGSGEGSKILIVTLIVLFHIILSVRDTILSIDKESVDYILSLGASKKQLFNQVIMPEIIPGIINNVRIKIRTAISILFFCELFGTSAGMGHYVLDAWLRNNYVSMYKGIIVVCFVGIMLFSLVDLAERKLVRWKNMSLSN